MLCIVDANVCVYVKCTIVSDVYVVYNYRKQWHKRGDTTAKAVRGGEHIHVQRA